MSLSKILTFQLRHVFEIHSGAKILKRDVLHVCIWLYKYEYFYPDKHYVLYVRPEVPIFFYLIY